MPSESQQSQGIGNELKNSFPPSINGTSPELQMLLGEELLRNNRVSLLGRMIGVASVNRNLQSEDAAYKSDLEEQARLMGASLPSGQGSPQQSVMCAGDINYNFSQPDRQQQSAKKTNPLVPLALATALGLSGLGAWAGLSALNKESETGLDTVTILEAVPESSLQGPDN